ncbi:hypothetical protein J437_LFUL011499 [Ladona fulva]|uniref:Uncharacterized protein n=1 Tax=Ladona fulva TaxID=123851 RepID=A0A8K0P2U2_LADFU|nr:hypothetical protein J437_LFUL011499 [Ladona fulva]
MSTNRPRECINKPGTKRILPLFKVTLSCDNNFTDFLQIKSICGMKVEIRDFSKPIGPPQCLNCMAYGHTKNVCSFSPNCSKCGGNHSIIDCPTKHETTPKCIHCSGNHTATYKGCPTYIKLRDAMRKRLESNRNNAKTNLSPPPLPSFPSLTPTNNTYSSAVTQPTTTNNPDPSTNQSNPNFDHNSLLDLIGSFCYCNGAGLLQFGNNV